MTSRVTFLPAVTRFLDWWGRELEALLPPPSAIARARRREAVILSVASPGGFVLLREAGGRRREIAAWPDADAVTDEIARRVRDEAGRKGITLRLPRIACFERHVSVPAAARNDLSRVLSLDLQHATPFAPETVLTDRIVMSPRDGGDQLAVRQFVLTRARVAPMMDALLAHDVPVRRIECWADNGRDALPVDFLFDRHREERGRAFNRRLWRYGLASVIGLLALAAYIHSARLDAELTTVIQRNDELRRQMADVRATEVRAAERRSRRQALIAARRAVVSRAQLIDELARIVPGSDYVTDLRIDGRKISMGGFSASVARLVPLIERSEHFADVRLAAPVTVERDSGKERFTIEATAEVPTTLTRRTDPGREG